MPSAPAESPRCSQIDPQVWQPMQRSPCQTVTGRASMLSGLWHQSQASVHPLKNTVVRMPGPSSVLIRWMFRTVACPAAPGGLAREWVTAACGSPGR